MGLGCLLGLFLLAAKKLESNLLPIVLALTCDIIEEILSDYCKVKFRYNLPVHYYFSFLQYSLYVWFIYANLTYPVTKKLILVTIPCFLVGILVFSKSFWDAKPAEASLMLSYNLLVKDLLLVLFCIIYFKNIIDQISDHRKIRILPLIIIGGMTFYFAFEALYKLTQDYLINYAEKHHISIYDVLKDANVQTLYASKQLNALTPLLYITNLLLYLCILSALIKSALPVTKQAKVGVERV